MKLVSTNPAKNYEIIGEVESSTKIQVIETVLKAHLAYDLWKNLTISERSKAVSSFVNTCKKRTDDLANIIATETGRPINSSLADVTKGISCFEAYLSTAEKHLAPKVTLETETEIHTVHYEPWGVIATICPWNFPFTNVAWQCGQALLAGNTIVYKNSEKNPLFAKLLDKIITESELPDGVFNILYGNSEVGEWIVRADINRISFTGSFVVGHKLAQIAAEKFIPITAELGGSNPYIVFPDATLDEADIENIYSRRFAHSGQFCTSVKRLIVHESKFDELVTKLKKVVSSKKLGDPFDQSTDLGPVVDKYQLEKLESQVQDAINKGAKVITGAKQPDGLRGAFYEPTILTNITKDMRVWTEETFGPVLPIISFSTEQEAIELANDTEYGLSSYILTNDKELFNRVAPKLQAGMIAQKQVVNLVAGNNPFGGYKHSGMGRENGEFGFHDATQIKIVSQQK
jgi:succinate-semialdehyde dehydrogenase/glutarate-semialdehyde dehydrogenase